jgi:hypothetical protein
MLEDALRDGGPAEAIARWLGPDADPEVLAAAQASARGFFADYAGLSTWSPSRRELRAIVAPVVFVTDSAEGTMAAAADAVSALVPGSVRRSDGDVIAAAASV